MAKIGFPRQLDELLVGSELFATLRAYADKAGEILTDNNCAMGWVTAGTEAYLGKR